MRAVTWALDLDGVVWLAGHGIAGSAQAVAELREAGERVVFLTNNSGPLVGEHLDALRTVGIECRVGDLASSAQAAASMLAPGSRVVFIGDAGIPEALEASGIVVVGPREHPDAVVVGRTVHLDYHAMAAAATAVRDGARFIGTNTDATFPTGDTGDGLVPGAGALVAFVATASGHKAEVAGKPHEPLATLVRARYGQLNVMVGDRPDTDGRFALRVGARFGLVLSGVTRRSDLPVEPAPAFIADDLLSLVRRELAARG